MGFNIISSSAFDSGCNSSNPNPNNYTLIKVKVVKERLLIKIKYHDCINYEGIKIMAYECTLKELVAQKAIDPHFSENDNYISPIARFEPTEKGWENGLVFLNAL